jgi:hypothetical protein
MASTVHRFKLDLAIYSTSAAKRNIYRWAIDFKEGKTDEELNLLQNIRIPVIGKECDDELFHQIMLRIEYGLSVDNQIIYDLLFTEHHKRGLEMLLKC